MNYLKCVKETSPKDVSFTSPKDVSFMHTKYLFDRERTLIIIIFESIYFFIFFSLYANWNSPYFKIKYLVPMTSNSRDSTVY